MKHILALTVLFLLVLGFSSQASAYMLIECPECGNPDNTWTHYVHPGCESSPNPGDWEEVAESDNGQPPPRGTNCRWCMAWIQPDSTYHWCYCTECYPPPFWPEP